MAGKSQTSQNNTPQKMLRFLLPAFLVGFVALFYNNCGQRAFQATLSPENIVIKLDEQQKASFAQLSVEQQNLICSPEALVCTERNYAPGLAPSEAMTQHCFSSAAGETCVVVKRINYDSTVAISACTDCTPEDAQPGGRYNFQEAYCESYNMNQFLGKVLRHYSNNVENAVSGFIQECQ
jgi:hypothetical protein